MGTVHIEECGMKRSIVFYDSWGELISNLPDDMAGALIKMICRYSFTGDVQASEDASIDAMFAMIRTKLDEDAEAYQETIRKRSEGGKKGMKSRWNNSDITPDNSVITQDNSVTKKITPITVSDSVSVSVSDNNKKSSRFAPPSLEEVKSYCQERNNGVNPETFIDFYASKGWKVGNQPMKDWKACVRTWERRDKSPDKPKGKPPDKIHFELERQYDFDELEKKLLRRNS